MTDHSEIADQSEKDHETQMNNLEKHQDQATPEEEKQVQLVILQCKQNLETHLRHLESDRKIHREKMQQLIAGANAHLDNLRQRIEVLAKEIMPSPPTKDPIRQPSQDPPIVLSLSEQWLQPLLSDFDP